MIRFRFELKYRITEAQAAMIAAQIRPHMRPDRHSANGQYTLASLYLDSDDLRLYREALQQVKNRIKLRIRSYSDDPAAPCFFEIKRRINRVGVKSRAGVPRWAVEPLLANTLRPSEVECDARGNLEQFLHYRQLIHARPMVELRYFREAYEGRRADDVRVTFDRQLSFRATRTAELGHDGCGWHQPLDRRVVLEIKFTHGYPTWIGRMVHELELRQGSNSKYKRAIKHEMRFEALPRLTRNIPWGVYDHALAAVVRADTRAQPAEPERRPAVRFQAAAVVPVH